jgi:hypothetical protein
MKTYTKEEQERIFTQYEKTKMTQKRQWVKSLLFVQKAKSSGITVTEDEIDKYIKGQK